ncbi:adenine-specific DNA-methyltransferase [Paralcaligenes ureilyticus]|uniref:site-specific DNA-methyltransferase (adenine-specific) n=2 Tax=Paralcaligenes ureilyticus TaxID=627131 RepID=A0A4R3MBM6_9BURK|nr:adenine-specific DNA-methyltransferase [Paralcaligenes ureilyticus]
MHSPDLTQENIAHIRKRFPGCVTETRDTRGAIRLAVDFDLLRQELADVIIEGPQERYQLTWPGKREALLTANAPISKTLRPCREESVDFDTTKNLFIEGDNLDALKLLQETYLGKVKVIYIDPPYNTGRDFIYDDDYSAETDEYLTDSGQKDDQGGRLVANTESNGRFHSDWLSMMAPRLRLARTLLKEDGSIFISIDDGEVQNLRSLCDEIFGAENFIATIIWHKMDSPKNSAKYLSEDHDYILLYAKNSNIWRPKLLPRSDKMVERYKNPDNDSRGPWLLGDLAARNFYSKGTYPITTPAGRTISGPPAGSYWRVSKEKFNELLTDNRIWWGESSDNRPGIKKFLSEVRDGVIPQTYWPWKEVGSTRNAKQELSKLLQASSGDDIFITPKPVKLIQRILEISTDSYEQEIVLDFFAGSGTTAHAAFSSNSLDGGNRRWIMIQLPEAMSSESTISEMCITRIKRAGTQLSGHTKGMMPNVDTGFRVLKVDSTNMDDVLSTPDVLSQADLLNSLDNIKPDRTAEDLLFQVMLDWGVDLALSIEKRTIQGKDIYFVDGNALAACFDAHGGVDEALVKELATYQPLRVVFRDAGFRDSAAKINVEQIFRTASPATDVKCI